MDEDFVGRVRALCDRAGGQSALARRLGMSLGAVQRYLRGGEPTRQVLVRMCESFGVSLDWLVYGHGETQAEGGAMRVDAAPSPGALPLYGLSEGAIQQGWYAEVRYRIDAMLDCADPEAFAVVVPDRGLEAEGIQPGQVCVISPHTRPRAGDAVFIRRTDGTAALRKFLRADDKWVHTLGGIVPAEGGAPVATREQLSPAAIRQMGTVIFVRRRP